MNIRWVLRSTTPVLLLVFSGCQHLAPEPLDLRATRVELEARSLDVAPIQAYAATLAKADAPSPEIFDAGDGLSLREGEAVALWYNLDLRVARLEAAQANAAAKKAGLWADPQLGLETGEKSVEAGGGTAFLKDAGEKTRSWINAGSLSITLPISGRLGAERKLFRTQHDVAVLRAAHAEWDTLTQLRNAWTDWSVAVAQGELLDTQLGLLDQFSGVATALAEAGELAPSSARLFAIERLRLQAERARVTHQVTERHAELLQRLGLLPDAPVTLLPEIARAVPEAETPLDLEQHPQMALLRAEYQAAEDRLKLELRKQYPDLTLSPTFSDEDDETALLLGMGLPIPVWNANRQGIAEAVGARAVARARTEAAYQRLIAEATQAEAALAGVRAQRAQLLDEVVPQIDTQMEEVLALLEIGEIDLIVLYEALNQALDTKEELLSATREEAIAAARLRAIHATGAIELNSTPEESE